MKQMTIWIALVITSLFLSSCGLTPVQPPAGPTATFTPTLASSPTQTPLPTGTASATTTPASDPEALYAELIAKIKNTDSDADFTAARMAYAQTKDYDPYNIALTDVNREMRSALEQREYDKTIELANQILEKNFLSLDAHISAFSAYKALNKTSEAGFHSDVLNGLIASILDSGDGKSEETAYVVISIEEEYAILSVLGIRQPQQALVYGTDHTYDQFEGADGKTGKKVTLYFQIDLIFQWMGNSLK